MKRCSFGCSFIGVACFSFVFGFSFSFSFSFVVLLFRLETTVGFESNMSSLFCSMLFVHTAFDCEGALSRPSGTSSFEKRVVTYPHPPPQIASLVTTAVMEVVTGARRMSGQDRLAMGPG